jgi:protein TonB
MLLFLIYAPKPSLAPPKMAEENLIQVTLEPPPEPEKQIESAKPLQPLAQQSPQPPQQIVEKSEPVKPKPIVRPRTPVQAPFAQKQTATDAPVAAEAPQAATAKTAATSAPVQPPVAPSGPKAQTPEEIYVATMRAYLDGIKRYPTSREARIERPEGDATAWYELDSSGALLDSGIEKTSGSMILDQAALSTVRRGEYAKFPAGAWDNAAKHRFLVTLHLSPN